MRWQQKQFSVRQVTTVHVKQYQFKSNAKGMWLCRPDAVEFLLFQPYTIIETLFADGIPEIHTYITMNPRGIFVIKTRNNTNNYYYMFASNSKISLTHLNAYPTNISSHYNKIIKNSHSSHSITDFIKHLIINYKQAKWIKESHVTT